MRPRGRRFTTTMLDRFLFGTVALDASRPSLRLGDVNNSSVNAGPAKFPSAMAACFSLGTVGVATSRATFLFGYLHHLSISAAPNGLLFAMPERFVSGSVTLRASRPGFRFGDLRDSPVDTDPTKFAAMCPRFLFGAESLTTPRAAFCFSRLDDTSVDAAPPRSWDGPAPHRTPRKDGAASRAGILLVLNCGENERLTGQGRKIGDQRMRAHDVAKIDVHRLRKSRRPSWHI